MSIQKPPAERAGGKIVSSNASKRITSVQRLNAIEKIKKLDFSAQKVSFFSPKRQFLVEKGLLCVCRKGFGLVRYRNASNPSPASRGRIL
jgi:hypothetical protein